ncbi:DNA/RNA non-specific endonuclease [Sphingomonas sp. GB1N7]|uniref:DNA/RNA non-specific endonuclease n=1 Tax=Parasphingomonas caseinilytica TaxID=3096158 RepID=UPI002FC82389
MPQDDNERRASLEGRLAANPRLAEAVRQRIAEGRLPPAFRTALCEQAEPTAGTGSSPLEEIAHHPAGLPLLEAIVRLTGRPPMLVCDDKVVMEPLPDFPVGTDLKIRALEKWIPSVGRVEFLNANSNWGGTGSVVATRGTDLLVMTNRHVAKLVAKRQYDGSGVFVRNAAGIRCGAEIDFREEATSIPGDRSRTVAVAAIDYLADDLAADVALLRIAPGAFPLPSVIGLADTEAAFGDLVALIGYPAFDPRNDADAQARYFHDVYDVKRFAPGQVMQALTGTATLQHDCTSLGGNSGSPLVDLNTGRIVGLHFSGQYGVGNSAVGVGTIKALLAGAFPIVAVPGSVAGTEGLADGVHAADHFKGRAGFATHFLGKGAVETPWPELPAPLAAALAAPSDGPVEPGELRYTHFGVKYSAAEKLPLMTAVNLDGVRAVRIKRSADKWFVDMRIAPSVQLGAKNFVDAEIDRGHMVRREDPNWGDPQEAEQANFDTFHYVNACAQHARLNQGKTLWQGLENYILDSARTAGFQACVFTGPVLGEDDPIIDGARVPLEFWKLVATLDADGKALRATAYLLSQGQLIRDLMEKRRLTESVEGVTLGAYRTFQIAIADLAAATGYGFNAYLAADPLRRTDESVAGADDGPRFIALETPADIVL